MEAVFRFPGQSFATFSGISRIIEPSVDGVTVNVQVILSEVVKLEIEAVAVPVLTISETSKPSTCSLNATVTLNGALTYAVDAEDRVTEGLTLSTVMEVIPVAD